MPSVRIGIIHNEPVPMGRDFSEASHDVLVQVEAIEKVLAEAGYHTIRIPFTRDVSGFIQKMNAEGVQLVFNLCETVDEDPRLAGHPAAILELMGIPFTGSPSFSLALSTDKLMTKRLLRAKGIRTPDYLVYDDCHSFNPGVLKFPVIAKPRYQDASIGIDQKSVFKNKGQLLEEVEELYASFGTLVIEEFVKGREFNVALLGYPSPRVLPIAEIDFRQFPEGLFRIVGYKAKWDKSSFEYHHTPRLFPGEFSQGVAETIEDTSTECFQLFMLRDYGRIDLRMDDTGKLHVLEVNANCCLSPDAGFAAAAEQAGMPFSEMIITLLGFMMERTHTHDNQACKIPR